MQLTGGEVIVESLIHEKVPFMIGIPGHGNLGLVDAIIKRQDRIGFIQPRAENAAVYMADGHYRASGRPLAVFTSIGPGAINTAIGLATSYVDSTAVLALTGDAHTYMRGKGILQEIERKADSDFIRILEPVTKRAWLASEVAQLPSILRRAFIEMMNGRRGPVAIGLPMNVQADSADVEIPGPHPYQRGPVPDRGAIEEAARLILEAKRPVILAGGGVNGAEAWDELRRVAEFTSAAVVTTLQGKGCFPEDHPLAGWISGSKGTLCGLELTRKADVILAAGCRFADETACSYRHGSAFQIPPAKLIHIDIDEGEIGKNYPVEIGIVADLREALNELHQALSSGSKPRENLDYTREIADLRERWFKSIREWEDEKREPMMITSLLKEIRTAIARNAIVCSSSGNTQAQILQEFPFHEPRTNITTGGFSTMGFGFPAAIGARLAHPDRQVIAIVGDGDFLMTMAEMATAVQFGIPVVVVVANNCGWMSIKDLQMAAYGENRAFMTDFLDPGSGPPTPNLARVAEEFGAFGERITCSGEVRPALKRALASGRPALVEAMCSREHPYTGSPALGWWDVPVPTYLEERRRAYEAARAEERL